MIVTRPVRERRNLSALLAGVLGLATLPALADSRGADSAVWVPLAPASGQAGEPVVLVPYEQSLQQGEHTAPQAWAPDYLPSGWRAGALPNMKPAAGAATGLAGGLNMGPREGAPDAAERLRNLPSHDSLGLVGYGLSADAWDAPPAQELSPARPLADVLRDAGWHHDTAARLRAHDAPGVVD